MATKKQLSVTKKSSATKKAPAKQAPAKQAPAKQAEPTVNLRELIAAMGGLPKPNASRLVGIRNIGGSTVGIAAFGNEQSISLHPFSPTDPNSMAVITWPRWQQIRKGSLFAQGLVERFDEIVDENERSPEDKPSEVHPDHMKNRIVDPVEFIESMGMDEAKFRTAVLAMTSENQLHRLLAVVDTKVRELQDGFRKAGDPAASRRAVEELPIAYQMAERLAQWRLDQLSPVREDTGLKPFQK
jgi:hypothetical protein